MAKTRRKRRKVRKRVCCAGAQCGGCELDVDERPNGVLFCDACHDTVHSAEYADLHWFTAHLDPAFITWSSHPDVVPPTPPPLGLPEESSQLSGLPPPSCAAAASATTITESGEAEAVEAAVVTAARWLSEEADAVLVCAGAGMSVDSGLPDFRGRDGWYKLPNGDDVDMEHVDFHPDSPHLLTAWSLLSTMCHAFRTHTPHKGYGVLLAHLFPDHRGGGSSSGGSGGGGNEVHPGAPRDSLPQMQVAAAVSAFVLTSNIDGYFARAGCPADALYECHGCAEFLQCTTVGGGGRDAEKGTKECLYASGVWSLGPDLPPLLPPCPAISGTVCTEGSSETSIRGATEAAATAVPPTEAEAEKAVSEPSGGGGGEPGGEPGGGSSEEPVARRGAARGAPRVAVRRGQLPRCRCGALARPNVSHTTDDDADLCHARKRAQRDRCLRFLADARTPAAAGVVAVAAPPPLPMPSSSPHAALAPSLAPSLAPPRASPPNTTAAAAAAAAAVGAKRKTLVVLEVGCGVGPHSLRHESELAVAAHVAAGGTAYLVRVDPHRPQVPAGVPLDRSAGQLAGRGEVRQVGQRKLQRSAAGQHRHIALKLGAKEALERIASAMARERLVTSKT